MATKTVRLKIPLHTEIGAGGRTYCGPKYLRFHPGQTSHSVNFPTEFALRGEVEDGGVWYGIYEITASSNDINTIKALPDIEVVEE